MVRSPFPGPFAPFGAGSAKIQYLPTPNDTRHLQEAHELLAMC
jgi:hypothetical protein